MCVSMCPSVHVAPHGRVQMRVPYPRGWLLAGVRGSKTFSSRHWCAVKISLFYTFPVRRLGMYLDHLLYNLCPCLHVFAQRPPIYKWTPTPCNLDEGNKSLTDILCPSLCWMACRELSRKSFKKDPNRVFWYLAFSHFPQAWEPRVGNEVLYGKVLGTSSKCFHTVWNCSLIFYAVH